MKILMVNKFLYPRGGAETYMLQIGEYLAAQGHAVQYFGMEDPKNTVGNEAGLYTYNMDFHTDSFARFVYPFKILYSREAYQKMCRVIDLFRPDVVHMNNINFQLTPSVIDAAHHKGVPIVQTVHDYQMICPNHLLYNLKEESICERCVRGSKWNCAKYGCIHGSGAKSLLGSLEAVLYWKKKTYQRVDRYLCPSRFLAEKLLSASEIYRGKTTVIHNYIELPDAAEEPPQKSADVVFAGRLAREKGIRLLAGAARLLPDVRFAVAGEGPDAAELAGCENVRMAGFLNRDALRRLMAEAAAVVVPSVWYENCPLTILEAQSVGTPVITADRGGMAELVEDGRTGVLVKETTAAGLAEAVRRLLGNQKLLSEMSQSCLKEREHMITLPVYCRQLIEIYNELIGKRGGGV